MILITSARGTNGIEIVRLLAGSDVPCRALVRNAQKAAALAALPKVEIVGGDLARPEFLAPAVEGVDKALLCSSIDSTSSSCKEILSARYTGRSPARCKVFRHGSDLNSEWRFLRLQKPSASELENSGLAFTHLQPDQFMQVYLRFQSTIAPQGKFYAASKGSEVSPVDTRDIATVAVAVLTDSDHEGKKYGITGPEALTYSAVAEKLSEAIGKKVSYGDVPLATAMKTLLDGGAPEWFAKGQAEQFRFRWQGKRSRVTATIAQVAKKKPATFDEFAREHAGYFRDGETAVPTAMPSAH